jgi:putative ABC transport system permease protein
MILALRPLVERPGRTALALLGIACGTALYAAIAMINASTIDYFAESVSSLTGNATVSVSGDATGFPEETLERVERVPGVDRVVPVLQVRARTGADRTQGVVVLGIDMLRESAVRKYSAADAAVLDDPLEFLNQADSILVTRTFADEHHLRVGDPLDLSTASGPQRFIVRGVLAGTGAAKAFGGRVVFMDIDAARVSFGKEGRTDRLDVLAKKDSGKRSSRCSPRTKRCSPISGASR